MTEPIDPNDGFADDVGAVVAFLEPLGYEPVVVCADGSEPCASLEVDGGWLDVTVTFREDGD